MDKIPEEYAFYGTVGTVSTIALLIIGMFVILGFRSCDQARTAYYEAQKNCVESGASWVTMSRDEANCLRYGVVNNERK